MDFSKNLQRCKEQKGMTIGELSHRSGVPVGTLSKLLSGAIGEPKVSVALSLAAGLGCSLNDLLDPNGTHVTETLNEEERAFLADYRRADEHSRELLRLVLDKQLSACKAPSEVIYTDKKEATRTTEAAHAARILSIPKKERRQNEIPLYDLPVSAGTGIFLDGDSTEMMPLPDAFPEGKATFALRVSGESMEPRFFDGDILLVHEQETVEQGDFGIFLADGEGYFKRFMGDCLHSLNEAYADIPLSNFQDFRCCGKVVGRLAKKK